MRSFGLLRKFGSVLHPRVHCEFNMETGTACYIVSCPESNKCAIIDSVLDYDPINHKVSFGHMNKVLAHVESNSLVPEYIIETHIHADHLTASAYLKERFPSSVTMIGSAVTTVQSVFKKILNLDLKTDGSQFGKLVDHNYEFNIGKLNARAISTPGHTPACMTYIIGNAVFVGDTVFMPDFGTSRCDFPGGSPETLYDSIRSIFELPSDYRVFVGHDYGTNDRSFQWETSILAERENNKQMNIRTSKEEFVKWRKERDSTLNLPKLIMQSLQVNLEAGKLPTPESNGSVYLKIPITVSNN